VCGNGQGSPCLDLRRVPDTLADATVGADLVVVEGMGRAIHTNYRQGRVLAFLQQLQCASAMPFWQFSVSAYYRIASLAVLNSPKGLHRRLWKQLCCFVVGDACACSSVS